MAMQLSNLIMGLIIANWLDYGMSFHPGSVQWRFPCAFPIVLCVFVCVFLPFLPESPRYLANVDKYEQAAHNLAALRGDHADSPAIAEELKEIQYAIAVESREAGSWSDCFKDGGVSGGTRVAIAFSANFFQQLSGVNVMSSLGPYIFEKSIGMTRYDALLVAGGLQVYYFLSSIIPWFIVDKAGRRRLFILGSAGMGTCKSYSSNLKGRSGSCEPPWATMLFDHVFARHLLILSPFCVGMLLSAIFVGIGGTGLGYAAAVSTPIQSVSSCAYTDSTPYCRSCCTSSKHFSHWGKQLNGMNLSNV